MKRLSFLIALSFSVWAGTALAAVTIPFTVTLSEAVVVTGTPRVAVDVGGVTRYATYTAGSGTTSLIFTLSPQAGDVDLDGIAVSSPIDLNGGTIKDTAGNDAALTFTPPNTSGIKIDYPSLSLDFVNDADGRYSLNGTVYNDLSSFLAATGGTFTRTSIATYYDASGTLQTASANTPRFDYDPVTHALKGILLEEQRTNVLTSSHGASYTHASMTVTPNAVTTPVGNLHRYTSVLTSQSRLELGSVVPANATYTASWYIKKDTSSRYAFIGIYDGADSWAYLDLDTGMVGTGGGGAITNPQVINIGNGVYRFSATCTRGAAPTVTPFKFGIAESFITDLNNSSSVGTSILAANFQVESGFFATSYIPTTAVAVTRSSDMLDIPKGSWFVEAAGTAYGESYKPKCNNGFCRTLGLAPSNKSLLESQGASIIETWSGVSGQTFGTSVSPLPTDQIFGRYGFSWDALTAIRSIVANGSAVATQSSYTGDYTTTSLRIGSGYGADHLNNAIRRIKIYPAKVTDIQLRYLTQ